MTATRTNFRLTMASAFDFLPPQPCTTRESHGVTRFNIRRTQVTMRARGSAGGRGMHLIRWIAISVVVLSSVVAQAGTDTVAREAKTCVRLLETRQPLWQVNSAEFVRPPFNVSLDGKDITVPLSFCRIVATATASPGSSIGFEVWLPARSEWNGKFQGVGSGGSFGRIEFRELARALVRGYAAVATDNGHRVAAGFDNTWALGHPERVADFGYRAEHAATSAGKYLTAKYYGRAPAHSYFVGCSQGGHHGLMEAQRFPADYDGIVAGAPVLNWTDEMTGQAWNVRALQRTPHRALPIPKLEFLSEAVHKACAGPDGLIDDPRKCSFDPGSLRCAAGETSCLVDAEIEAVRQMYSGPVSSSGVQIYPGLTRGGEAGWDLLWSDPDHLGGSWLGVYRMMVFEDPNWDPSTLDFDRDPNKARAKLGPVLDPDNPDLTHFAARGGKLIVYHGWADDMVPAVVSIDYYDKVAQGMGAERARSFYRLFMIPGMYHCNDGPGANLLFHSEKAPAVPLTPRRDLLTALEEWVEHGHPPDEFVASRLDKSGRVERTRLVCAYPKLARYAQEGDTRRAESWTCETR